MPDKKQVLLSVAILAGLWIACFFAVFIVGCAFADRGPPDRLGVAMLATIVYPFALRWLIR